MEEGGRGISGAAVAGGERFCMSSMNECNFISQNWQRGLRDELTGGKGGVGSPITIFSTTPVVSILPDSPEWSNRFQGQELQRAVPILLIIGEMGQDISGVGGRSSAVCHHVA